MATLTTRGLSETWKEKAAAHGRLMLDAQIALGRHDERAARALFVQGAALAEELAAEVSAKPELRLHYTIQAFSAASGWAWAGEVDRALAWCDRLLQDPTTPPEYRRDVQALVANLTAPARPQPVIDRREPVAAVG